MPNVKRVYTFGNKQAEGNGKMRELLGGKGANLAEMNLIGIPVPPGFTITTEVCTEYYEHGKEKVVELIRPAVEDAVYNVTTGLDLPDAEEMVWEGHTFVGWYENEAFTGEPVAAIEIGETGSRTYYARWQEQGAA